MSSTKWAAKAWNAGNAPRSDKPCTLHKHFNREYRFLILLFCACVSQMKSLSTWFDAAAVHQTQKFTLVNLDGLWIMPRKLLLFFVFFSLLASTLLFLTMVTFLCNLIQVLSSPDSLQLPSKPRTQRDSFRYKLCSFGLHARAGKVTSTLWAFSISV